ncbi:hypothetical protein [Sorangium sp. So ce1153]|uniref:hypothetical protein n=1 Tax=Sorangium sp. So ce1153 TaxID=3133333 RepID=UPI003F5DD89F
MTSYPVTFTVTRPWKLDRVQLLVRVLDGGLSRCARSARRTGLRSRAAAAGARSEAAGVRRRRRGAGRAPDQDVTPSRVEEGAVRAELWPVVHFLRIPWILTDARPPTEVS